MRDDYEKSELHNQHFQSDFPQNDYQAQIENKNEPKLKCLRFSPKKIKTGTLKFDVNSAVSHNHIGNARLKNLAEPLPKSLSTIFSLIANKAAFPAKWRAKFKITFFKEGYKQNASNYRPNSVPPAVSRLLENLVFDTM